MSSLAFKEWQAIVGALAAGDQTLILRKGGISEDHGGFAVKARRFWLFPTAFHAQREKTKPAAHRYFEGGSARESSGLALSVYAELVSATFSADWDAVQRLRPFHLWTGESVRERFDWGNPPGLHVLIVRIFRIRDAIALTPTAAMAGCKSWIDVPPGLKGGIGAPVLDDATFAARHEAVERALASR